MRTLIKNASIVTQNKKREYIPNGFIVIKDDKLEKIAVGFPEDRDVKRCDKIINAKKTVVLPGFINAHVHLGESVFKDFFKGKYLLDHYLRVTDELTKKTNLIESGREIVADYSLLNLMKNGTTTICGGRTRIASERWGIKNVSGYILMDSFKLKKFIINADKKFRDECKKIKKTKLTYPALFVHSINTIKIFSIENVKKILNEYPEVILILHIAETKKQEEKIKNKFGISSVKFLYESGMLNSRTILIHGNWISDDDINIIKKCKASIVHCLSSNLKVADKTLNLNKIIQNGIKSCIATDGLVTSGTFSVLNEAKKCFTYHNRGQDGKNNLISLQKILDLITIDAAKVLRLENIIGSIEKGKKADITFLNKKYLRRDVTKWIIKDKHEILGVMLDGKLKIWDKRVLMKDEEEVKKRFSTLKKRVREEVR